jgi:hypothetical protein
MPAATADALSLYTIQRDNAGMTDTKIFPEGMAAD